MGRHADLLEEAAQRADALARSALRVFEIHLDAEHAVCKLRETGIIIRHFVLRPRREQHGKTGAVGDLVAERGKLMLELVHREQALSAAAV